MRICRRQVRSLSAMIATAIMGILMLLFFVRSTEAQVTPDVTGSIAGRVVDESGQGLTDIRITLFQRYEDSWSSIRSLESDETGAFLFDYVSTGIYRLRFEDPNAVLYRIYYPDALQIEGAADIPIAGQAVTNLTTVMRPGGALEGSVELWNGEPLYGVDVILHRLTTSGWTRLTSFSSYNSQQDQAIQYHFRGLQPLDYQVEFRGDRRWPEGRTETYAEFYENGTTHAEATHISVGPSETVADIDAILGENPSQALITGTIQSLEGLPLPGIVVSTYVSGTSGWTSQRSTASDDTGSYELRTLPPATYKLHFLDYEREYVSMFLGGSLSFDSADTVSLTAGQEVTALNVAMTATGGISGTVVMLDGNAPERLTIEAYAARTAYAEIEHTFHADETLPAYELFGMAPDRYRLFFRGRANGDLPYSEFYHDALNIDEAIEIEVMPGAVTGDINVTLGENPIYSTVSGHVSTAAGGPPLSMITVSLVHWLSSGHGEIGVINGRERANTDATGFYRLPVLSPGKYSLLFEDYQNQIYHVRYYENATTITDATRFPVAEGENVIGMDVVLQSDGIISGSVAAFDGRPLARYITLELYEQDGEDWAVVDSKSFWGDTHGPDYVWGGLPEGIYRMLAQAGSSDDEFQYFPDAQRIEDADDIQVSVNNVTPDISFSFGEDDADARIEGVVTLDGTPQPGMHVEIYQDEFSRGDWWQLVYMVTDAEGRFVIDGLTAGSYRICVADPGGAVARICHRYAESVEGGISISLLDGQIITDLHLEMTPEIFRLRFPLIR